MKIPTPNDSAEIDEIVVPRAAPCYPCADHGLVFPTVGFVVRVRFVQAARPLPDVAAHIERSHPRCPAWLAAHVRRLIVGITAINRFAGVPRVAPGINQIIRPTGGVFPFSLGRQSRSALGAESFGLVLSNSFYRAIVASE